MALCPMTAPRYFTLHNTTDPGGGGFPLARGRIRLHYAHAKAVIFPHQVAWLHGINDLDAVPSVSRIYQVFCFWFENSKPFCPGAGRMSWDQPRLLSGPLDQPPERQNKLFKGTT